MRPRPHRPETVRADGIMVTDHDLDALWIGTPSGGRLRADAAAWIAARSRALAATPPPSAPAAKRSR